MQISSSGIAIGPVGLHTGPSLWEREGQTNPVLGRGRWALLESLHMGPHRTSYVTDLKRCRSREESINENLNEINHFVKLNLI